jgi:uncharacterized protein (DUF952 family)
MIGESKDMYSSLPSQKSICRILTVDVWNQVIDVQGSIPLGDLDRKDGFVHLSTIEQVLETLNRYFSMEQKPIIIVLDEDRIHESLQWEIVPQRNHDSFPHLYRKLHFDDIKGVWEVDFQKSFVLGAYTKIEECFGKVEKSDK